MVADLILYIEVSGCSLSDIGSDADVVSFAPANDRALTFPANRNAFEWVCCGVISRTYCGLLGRTCDQPCGWGLDLVDAVICWPWRKMAPGGSISAAAAEEVVLRT